MFTNQVQVLENLRGQVPDELITVLRQLLGNCSQDTVTRGTLSIDAAPVNGPIVPYNTTDPVYAALHSYNTISTFNPDSESEPSVHNGFAGDFMGVVRFNAAKFPDPAAGVVNNIAVVINGVLWAVKIIVQDLVINGDLIINGTVNGNGFSEAWYRWFTVDSISPPQPTFTQLGITVNAVGQGSAADIISCPFTSNAYLINGMFPGVQIGDKGVALWVRQGAIETDHEEGGNWWVIGFDSAPVTTDPTGTPEAGPTITVGGITIYAKPDLYAKAKASVAVSGATGVFTITDFVNLSPQGGTMSGVTSATNPLGIYMSLGDDLRLAYNHIDAVWEAIAAAHKAKTISVSNDKDGADLRYQTKTISVNAASDTTSQNTWATTTECP